MGYLGRLKNFAGATPIRQVASATTITVAPENSTIELTGTTEIANIAYDQIRAGRILVLICKDATGPAITDTAIASTAAQKVHTGGSLVLANGESLVLQQQSNGSWWQLSTAAPA